MSDRPLISIILPTVRPALIVDCLASLTAAASLVPPTEIIVVADFEPPIEHQPWILRDRRGPIDAIHLGYQAARGDYVFVTNDEARLEVDALLLLYQDAVMIPGRLLSPTHLPPFPFAYYGRPFVPFPFAHRDVFDALGGLFDPAFKAFYADPDLSMRAHAAGVPVHVVASAAIHHHNGTDGPKEQNWMAYIDRDRAVFRARWDHLGAFRDP